MTPPAMDNGEILSSHEPTAKRVDSQVNMNVDHPEIQNVSHIHLLIKLYYCIFRIKSEKCWCHSHRDRSQPTLTALEPTAMYDVSRANLNAKQPKFQKANHVHLLKLYSGGHTYSRKYLMPFPPRRPPERPTSPLECLKQDDRTCPTVRRIKSVKKLCVVQKL